MTRPIRTGLLPILPSYHLKLVPEKIRTEIITSKQFRNFNTLSMSQGTFVNFN